MPTFDTRPPPTASIPIIITHFTAMFAEQASEGWFPIAILTAQPETAPTLEARFLFPGTPDDTYTPQAIMIAMHREWSDLIHRAITASRFPIAVTFYNPTARTFETWDYCSVTDALHLPRDTVQAAIAMATSRGIRRRYTDFKKSSRNYCPTDVTVGTVSPRSPITGRIVQLK